MEGHTETYIGILLVMDRVSNQTSLALRAACIHGRYESHAIGFTDAAGDLTCVTCSGGRVVIDAELVRLAAEAQRADPSLAAVWADVFAAIGDVDE